MKYWLDRVCYATTIIFTLLTVTVKSEKYTFREKPIQKNSSSCS